jgi:hypothetical protein
MVSFMIWYGTFTMTVRRQIGNLAETDHPWPRSWAIGDQTGFWPSECAVLPRALNYFS